MKLRIHGLTQEELNQQAPEILQKAARAMNVVLVEKEPTFEDKSFLPHTDPLVAKFEDWYYQQFNHSLDTLKNVLVRKIAGKEIKEGGVINRAKIVPNHPAKTTAIQLQKSRVALIHMKNILSNPGTSKLTRRDIYNRARQIISIAPDNKKIELIDIFNEIRDLV